MLFRSAFSFAACVAVTGEDGDEGDGGCSADEEVGDHVGQNEGGVECVSFRAAAEGERDVLHAHKAHQAREDCGDHQQHGGGIGGVAVRGTQDAQDPSQRGERWCFGGRDVLRFGRLIERQFG